LREEGPTRNQNEVF